MIRMQVDEGFRSTLETAGFSSYPTFLGDLAGELVEADHRRDIWRVQVGYETCYLKRVRMEGISAALESYGQGQLAHSKPWAEMLHIAHLRTAGVAVARVIAAGERLRLGVPQEGFIMTLEVKGENLEDIYVAADATARAAIMERLGALVASLHRDGFYATVRIRDIISSPRADGEPEMVLIDRETRNPAPRRFSSRRAKNSLLTSLRRSQRDGSQIPAADLRSFLRAYCREPGMAGTGGALALLRELRT